MLCDPVLLSAESVLGVELFRSLFSPLKPASLTLYQAVDLSVNRWLGFCPTIIPVSPKLWCGWLGKLWLRRDLSTLPSIKILHYLQYFLVFFKTFRPCCFSYLRPAVFCTFKFLLERSFPQRGRNPFPLSSSHVDCSCLLFWLPGVPASKTGLSLNLSSSCGIKHLPVEKPRDYLMWLQRECACLAELKEWVLQGFRKPSQPAVLTREPLWHQEAAFTTEQDRGESSLNHLVV